MKAIEYYRHEFHGDPEKVTGDMLSFVYDVPYLPACEVFPPLHILNRILIEGGGDGGMSPGASWEPFELTEEEYSELWSEIDKTDVSSLSDKARYAEVKFIRDPEFDNITDRFEWMEKVCEKHRDRYMRESGRADNK